MEMNVNITPEEINKFIADKILQSKLGETLDARVKEVVSKLSQSWDNPYDALIRGEINDRIKEIIEKDYKTYIEEEVKKRITTEMVDRYIENAWKKLTDRY